MEESVSLISLSIELYSSQFDIPSKSGSPSPSPPLTGFRVQSSSNKLHLAWKISQPSGIPSLSESEFRGSAEPISSLGSPTHSDR